MTAETIAAGALVVGLMGILLPISPGCFLVLAGIAVWALPRLASSPRWCGLVGWSSVSAPEYATTWDEGGPGE